MLDLFLALKVPPEDFVKVELFDSWLMPIMHNTRTQQVAE